MAWADAQRDEYKLAEMAFDQLILEELKLPQCRQIYFLRIIAAVGEGEKQKAQEWQGGINIDGGYALHRNFILISLPIVILIPLILVTWATILLKRQNKKDKNSNLSVIRTVVIVGCLWILIGINGLYIAKQIQGKEMIVSHDEKYTYLDVITGDLQKTRYRTNSPFIMQKTSHTQILMQKAVTNKQN